MYMCIGAPYGQKQMQIFIFARIALSNLKPKFTKINILFLSMWCCSSRIELTKISVKQNMLHLRQESLKQSSLWLYVCLTISYSFIIQLPVVFKNYFRVLASNQIEKEVNSIHSIFIVVETFVTALKFDICFKIKPKH